MHLMAWELVWKEGFFLLCYGIGFYLRLLSLYVYSY
jgi:hypothetical protein